MCSSTWSITTLSVQLKYLGQGSLHISQTRVSKRKFSFFDIFCILSLSCSICTTKLFALGQVNIQRNQTSLTKFFSFRKVSRVSNCNFNLRHCENNSMQNNYLCHCFTWQISCNKILLHRTCWILCQDKKCWKPLKSYCT